MKFGKEINKDLVPEWQPKYFDYRIGKKKINAIVRARRRSEIQLESWDQINSVDRDFRDFLQAELKKIENFYVDKEHEAAVRLEELRSQLQQLADHGKWLERNRNTNVNDPAPNGTRKDAGPMDKSNRNSAGRQTPNEPAHDSRAVSKLSAALTKRRTAESNHASGIRQQSVDLANADLSQAAHVLRPNLDYVRHSVVGHPSDRAYEKNRHKLRLALQEFYRELELIKSYADINKTAFRKINKKYDKLVNPEQKMQFMTQEARKAYFAKSTMIDTYLEEVENLYMRYLENNNHKAAMRKLRRRDSPTRAYTATVFFESIIIGAGLALGIEGVVKGAYLLLHGTSEQRQQTSYLLQIYAGYFHMLLLFFFFAIDCIIFERSRVNYSFIFELNPRNRLNWRQMFKIPGILFFLFSIFLWLNFTVSPRSPIFLYWPVILVGLSLIVLFMPVPILYPKARKWFLVSVGRLPLAPFPSVNFRDFFFGDMFCSETYALGNIELFFCLYRFTFHNPEQCNSSHSMLLGFFAAYPGIVRFLQCMRRYWDTRNAFPHVANAAKYLCTILTYMTLSLYRLDKTHERLVVFCVFATLNGFYTSFWDLAMDWSLVDLWHPKRLTYKRVWVYYAAAIVDPILRFNWIFYAIYTRDVQHSSVVSFFVGLSEVIRRGIWAIFRVENEHRHNVMAFKAARQLTLPYEVSGQTKRFDGPMSEASATPSIPGRPSDLERASSTSVSTVRSMPSIRSRVGHALQRAHTQDFVRRPQSNQTASGDEDEEDDDDDDDDLTASESDA